MMKKSFFFALIAVFSFSLLSTSCGGSDDPATPVDKEAPVMSVKTPTENAKLLIGDPLNFKAEFSDNVGLASYKIDIHINDGHHEHSAKDLPSLRGITSEVAFSFSKTYPISGKTFSANEEIDIPLLTTDPSDNTVKSTKAGDYHMVIYLLDTSGNQTVTVRNIKLAAIGS